MVKVKVETAEVINRISRGNPEELITVWHSYVHSCPHFLHKLDCSCSPLPRIPAILGGKGETRVAKELDAKKVGDQ